MNANQYLPRIAASIIIAAAAAAPQADAALSATTVSQATRPLASTYGAEQISGISWAGGDLYYAVDDNDNKLYPITLKINRDTGSLASGTNGITIGTGVVMAGANDMEGCAFDPASGKVWISQETGALVGEYDPAAGRPFAITGIRILEDGRLELDFNGVREDLGDAGRDALYPVYRMDMVGGDETPVAGTTGIVDSGDAKRTVWTSSALIDETHGFYRAKVDPHR